MSKLGSLRCPGCNNKVLQKSTDGAASLRPAGSVRFSEGFCYMSCHFCKRDLELPLKIEKSKDAEIKLIESARLIMRK